MRTYILNKIRGNNPKDLEFAPTPSAKWLRLSSRAANSMMALTAIMFTVVALGTLSQRRAMAEDIRQAQEARCLALTIYWEGERSNVLDKVAIAQNVIERSISGNYAATICGVVNEIRKNHATKADTAMYSYIFDGRADPGLNGNREWTISQTVANESLADWKANGRAYDYFKDVRQLVSYSVNYHAEMKKWPEWATADVKSCRLKPLGKIGAHFHYADFRRADPEGQSLCLAALKQQRNRLAAR